MDLDTAQSIEVITVSTSSSPGTSVKKVVPLQIDLERFPALDKDDSNKLRRPVRPIDRQRMRPWLMELLDLGNVFGLRWTNRHQGIFQISWRHASRLGWNLETDGDVFERWARHTGIYKEGDPPEPKRWKANFRCALHSLHDVVELTNAVERRGRNACRTYRFLQSNDEQSISRKRAKARRAKQYHLERPLYERSVRETVQPVVVESGGSSEEIVSDTESEGSPQDKVIVQKLDTKSDMPGEDYFLHHDHDYAGPDKTQKTILLRQGIGSIVLHKEVISAPEETEEERQLLMSNLDQLASAAVSTASLESTSVVKQPSKERKSNRIAKHGATKFTSTKQTDEVETRRPEFSLKHLLVGTKIAEDDRNPSSRSVTRKRKSSTPVAGSSKDNSMSESPNVKKGDRRKTVEAAVTTVKVRTMDNNRIQDPSSSLTTSTKRTSSPKILCRRSKRHKSKSEKTISESTEPLMSSCLLLLEAATRLDNEEKKSTSSLSSASNINTDEQNLGEMTMKQEMDSVEVQSDSDGSDKKIEVEEETYSEDMEEVQERQDFSFQTTASSSHQSSPGILRTTLENADKSKDDKESVSKPKTIRNLLKESTKLSLFNAISVSEGKIVVSEAPFAKGLFSGSTIQSSSQPPPSTSSKKKVKGNSRQQKGKTAATNANNNESATIQEEFKERGRPVAYSVLETQSLTSPSVSTIKSNSGVQQLVIQRALPVLSSAVQKNVAPRLDINVPVVVSHGLSHIGNSPQILISADTNLSHSKLGEQGVSIVKSKSQMRPELNVPTVSLLSMESVRAPVPPGNSASSQMKLFKPNESVGSLVSVFSTSGVTRGTSSSTETSAHNSMKKPSSSIKIAPASSLRTVTFTASSGMHTFSPTQSVAAKALPVHPHTFVSIPVKSDVQTSLQPAAACQYVASLKSSSAHPQTLILGNPQATPQKKDVLILEPGKQTLNPLKFHVVPWTNSSQLKPHTEVGNISNIDNVSVKNNPQGSVRNTNHPVQMPTQVVIDPSKGTFLKIANSSNVFQASSLAPSQSDSPVHPCQPTIKPVAPSLIESKQVIMTSKENVVDSVSDSSLHQSPETNDVLSHQSVLDPSVTESLQEVKPLIKQEADNFSEEISQKTQVVEPERSSGLNSSSSVSLLHKKSYGTTGGSSIVLDFQQALQAHKMTQALANVTKISLDQGFSMQGTSVESSNVKSLAELCKRYLANLFTALDSQTSESDENDSVNDSPKVEVKEEVSSVSLLTEVRNRAVTQNLGMASPVSVSWHTGGTNRASHFSSNGEQHLTQASVESTTASHQGTMDPDYNSEAVVSSTASGPVTQVSASTEQSGSPDDYSSRLMDPTAPLAIGEIPLFATGKGDTESLSPGH